MKVIVAKTAGFCWGVRRAMDAVLEASARGSEGTVQTLGPLIHNPQALELIRRRGVTVAETPGAVQAGTVVIRAHGIPIQDLRGLKERSRKGELQIVNATCPEVAKVHSRIKKWSPKGYFVIILGTHGHAESVAHQSFAQNGSVIVSTMEEARALTDEQLAKALVVAQTTFTVKDFQAITDYLRGRSGACIVENTICEDTWTRQEEAREIAEAVDYVIVVGGKFSSNTKHLAELAQRMGKPVQFVETAAELDLQAFRGSETVGVMAGASTPTWLVEEVVDVLQQHGGSTRAHRFRNPAFTVPLKLAVGAGVLTLGIGHWTGLPFTWRYPAITTAYALAMYLLTPYLDPLGLGSKGPGRARLLERSRHAMVWTAWVSLVAAFALASSLGVGSLLVVGGATLFGLGYKRKLRIGSTDLSLKSIPGSTTTNLDLRLQPALTLSVKVRDAQGKPIPAATANLVVHAGNMAFSLNQAPAKADDQGVIEIKGLPQERRYSVTITAKGYGSANLQAQIGDTKTNRFEFPAVVLKAADRKLAGQVLGPDSKPVSGANVNMQGEGQPSDNTRTDAQGHFVFGAVCEGAVQLFANGQGGGGNYMNGQSQAQGGDTNVVIRFGINAQRRRGQRAGGDDCRQGAGSRRRACGRGAPVNPGASGRNMEVRSEADGKYSITWQKQNFGGRTAFILARDVERHLAASHDLDNTATNLDLRLQPALTLSVKVQDAKGKPIPAATANLLVYSGNAGYGFSQTSAKANDQASSRSRTCRRNGVTARP